MLSAAAANRCTPFPPTLSISEVDYNNYSGIASGTLPNDGTVASLQCSAECANITATGIRPTVNGGLIPKYVCQNLEDESEVDFRVRRTGPARE
jgi:galacturan 1,4-alpha-galacturonidase